MAGTSLAGAALSAKSVIGKIQKGTYVYQGDTLEQAQNKARMNRLITIGSAGIAAACYFMEPDAAPVIVGSLAAGISVGSISRTAAAICNKAQIQKSMENTQGKTR